MQTYIEKLLESSKIETLKKKAELLDNILYWYKTDTEIQKHEICKYLALFQYDPQNYPLKSNMKIIEHTENEIDGFYADAINYQNETYIVVKGTDMQYNKNFFIEPDIKDDYRIISKSITPKQLESSKNFYNTIKNKPDIKNIILVGYSLGGTIQQRLGAETGEETVTFNAIGSAELKPKIKNPHTNNITNYTNKADLLTLPFCKEQLGKIYVIPYNKNDINIHSLESLDSLSKRETLSNEKIEFYSKNFKNIYLKLIEVFKPFYKKEADKIKNQYSSENITTNKNLNYSKEVSAKIVNYNSSKNNESISSNKQCVGAYSVSEYTRSDGTNVNSYIRRCGAAHNTKSSKIKSNNIIETSNNKRKTFFIPKTDDGLILHILNTNFNN